LTHLTGDATVTRIVLLAALVGTVLLSTGFWLSAQKPEVHDPANAIANLDIHPEVQATLFASEPVLTNPTNLDIDHRGRVWVCDVMNYRGNNGKRPEGDRILILEDTDGDGKHDKVKTFYQNRDIDSAMGICVLGNKVIVSASPNIYLFTFDDDDKVLSKEVFFTKTGQGQHDHSAHSFVFGPDGKLYWNFGNTGKAVHDRNGRQVVDRAGNLVIDNGKPYYGGMVFRCDMKGGNFEVLGHNFRNNYEVTIDSFGTLWQSDNDDDGNRGVRINYVMEFGNFGYRDELTGASWQTKRTNMETEIPLRHWHLNDPGVVPNLLQTGAGSPCGICVNEGSLLPKVFRNQVIHADAGPSVARAYPVVNDGAGYKAEIVNILDGQKKNNWFRPADVCIAPDGSLFVTDWYDPGVGGHAQRDSNRGRIFRVAPPGSKYQTPRFDFQTADGAAEALKSPNLAVRYLAWTALHRIGEKAEPALLKLWQSDDPRLRARALWLLGKINGKGLHYVGLAQKDRDVDIRIVGVRLLRQLVYDLSPILEKVMHDPSPQVRREIALALAHDNNPAARDLWVQLALQHDGKDRWYLEALGIGADRFWEQCLEFWLRAVGDQWNTPAGRDIIWRSRATRTSEYLAKIIADPNVPVAELPRYFRAFDYQKGDGKDDALARLAFGTAPEGPRQDLIAAEAISRLKSFDAKKNAAALNRLLDRHRGTALYVDLVEKFAVSPRYPDLLALAQKNPEDQLAVNAVRILLDKGERDLLQKGLRAGVEPAIATAKALGTSADGRAAPLLLAVVKDGKADAELRRQAARALARSRPGALQLIELAKAKQLPEDVKSAAGAVLQQATWKEVRAEIETLFPLPPSKDNTPLPPISELVKRKGNASKGAEVFAKVGTCANCHVVNGAGKEVGPDLSEIGKKLSREALYESILFPSAGISHNYETYQLATRGGTAASGVLVSQTPAEVTLKGADAIVRTFKKSEIEVLEKSNVSLMPADLLKALTAQDVVDVVEYMLTLKEAKKK
jgi:putative membrane-bound dehydrogenase-like protein